MSSVHLQNYYIHVITKFKKQAIHEKLNPQKYKCYVYDIIIISPNL